MRVLMVNSVCGIRSTGRICSETAQMLIDRGDECLVMFGRENLGAGSERFGRKYGNFFTNVLHYLIQMLFDDDGAGSYFVTKKMVRDIKKFAPDIVHLHNIHGHFVNYSLLMKYLAKSNVPVVFSFYDCWMFTGNCCHFDYYGCDKWKTQCKDCPIQNKYPFDKLYMLQHFMNNTFENLNYQKLSAAAVLFALVMIVIIAVLLIAENIFGKDVENW